jgi:cellulose synthase/poly-beta-1,6-N-acetylglucosamine synthase-like glycosyltransferase
VSGSVQISVVVPTHNRSRILPRALSHIAEQRVPKDLRWEVILVDNGSTDGTAELAPGMWPADAPVELRVVREPKLGLTHAHVRGFAEARGELVTWVEDDTWIAPDWVEIAWRTMEENPEVGACGGFNEPVCEGGAPAWFNAVQASFGTGPQGRARGDYTDDPTYLWGAGMTVRRRAWLHLIEGGFRPGLVDRQGTKNYSSGGDVEISFALRLSGWRLRFEPSLRLRHVLPRERLDWAYLRRLTRGQGAASPGLDPYRRALGEPLAGDLVGSWRAEARRTLAGLYRHRRRLLSMSRSPSEGDSRELGLEVAIGRLGELLRQRGSYDRGFAALENAAWRRPRPVTPALDRLPG